MQSDEEVKVLALATAPSKTKSTADWCMENASYKRRNLTCPKVWAAAHTYWYARTQTHLEPRVWPGRVREPSWRGINLNSPEALLTLQFLECSWRYRHKILFNAPNRDTSYLMDCSRLRAIGVSSLVAAETQMHA